MNKRAIIVLAVLFQYSYALVPLLSADSPTAIPDQYVFRFLESTTKDQRTKHMNSLFKTIKGDFGQYIIAQYDFGTFQGFAAKLNAASLAQQLKHDELFSYIESDQTVQAIACTQQQGADWGLDRVDQVVVNLNGNYQYDSSSGSGVDAYIVDTGILITHSEFGNRATWGANYVDTNNVDCNGHGTHVAGTVGGNTYGIAKSVNLIAVKVLNCAGSGTWNGVISGIQYVATQAGTTKRPTVANMSLGGGKSTAVNDAVSAAVKAGVSFAVAAGNENQDACNVSPASTPDAITVGATTIDDIEGAETDERSTFSNYGTCVTLLAPGQLIKSAWIGSNTATNTISGTSMASPHACGVAAMYLGLNPMSSPAQVKSWMAANANANMINMICTNDVCRKTPNLLLYNACA